MNYCAKGHFIPDNALECPECFKARAQAGWNALQIEFLRKAANGETNYALRVARGGDRHVLMYTSYTKTFCGQELKARPQIAYETFDAEALSRVCAGCRVEIKRALQEIQ